MTASTTHTALVAAAPTLLRQGLVALLTERWPQLRLTLTGDAAQAVELVASSCFRLLVLDDALPGRALPELLSRLHRARPAQQVVVLTASHSAAHLAGATPKPGNVLCLPRHGQPHALLAALAAWLDAPAESPPARDTAQAMLDPFSRRELEVLRLVVADCCNEEIATRLFINVRTVETHRRNLLHKAGTRTVVGLTARAVREGWVA